ncbi:MAG TPA: TIM barrel protein [Terriglobia bacterium]|nr:TIM barrel protein [Terriglobia bacterium]
MDRRDFLVRWGQAAAAGLMGGTDLAALARRRRRVVHHYVPGPRSRIGVSTWSFHRFFVTAKTKGTIPYNQQLALLDFPGMIAERYKVHNLEFAAPHFASTEAAYVTELRNQLVRAHSTLVNIPVDIDELWTGGGLSDPNPVIRNAAIGEVKKWIDMAHTLRGRSVRADPGKFDPQNPAPTVESYRQLVAYGKPLGIFVLIENHAGIGYQFPDELANLIKRVGSPYLRALPDFGNFLDETTRLRGLRLLFPLAISVCHAKGLKFDAQGQETQFDFGECVAISRQLGFKGIYSVEFEGPDDPYAGVENVVNELAKYL